MIDILGGHVRYDSFIADHATFDGMKSMNGMRTTVKEGIIKRLDDGRIESHVHFLPSFGGTDHLIKMMSPSSTLFTTSDEFLSNDVQKPTIFQNVVHIAVPKGSPMANLPGMPAGMAGSRQPFGIDQRTLTEAVAYLENNRLVGTFSASSSYQFTDIPPGSPFSSVLPTELSMTSEDTFKLLLRNAVA